MSLIRPDIATQTVLDYQAHAEAVAASPTRARVLSIEGSDPIGGAGTMADMKAFTAHGVFGYAAMTCVCAQNTQGVTGIVNMEPAFLRDQLDSVADDGIIDSMKIGMLGTGEIVDTVRDWLSDLLADYEEKGLPRPWVVIDPVMYAKSGDALLTPDAEERLRTILPLADVITPNVPELAALAGHAAIPGTWDEAVELGRQVADDLGVAVYVKAGMFALNAAENAASAEVAGAEGAAGASGAEGAAAEDASAAARRLAGTGANPAPACDDALVIPASRDGADAAVSAASGAAVSRVNAAPLTLEQHEELLERTGERTLRELGGAVAGGLRRVSDAVGIPVRLDAAEKASRPRARVVVLPGRRVPTVNVHGTGDTLSATLAALRPQYATWEETALAAKRWMTQAIAASDGLEVGKGHGPVDFTWMAPPTARTFSDDYWNQVRPVRERIAGMPFIRRMLDGSLDLGDFSFYLHQDDLYLTDYSSLLALASSRADTLHDRAFFARCAAEGVDAEVSFHGRWFEEHGFSRDAQPMSVVTAAYIGHEHRVADMGDYGLLAAVVMPCFWLYGAIGLEFKRQAEEMRLDLDSHPYGAWIAQYSDTSFNTSVAQEIGVVNRLARLSTRAHYDAMMEAALVSSEHEYRFFNQGIDRPALVG